MGKDHVQQPAVAENIASQIREGETGILGVMVESFLKEGNQSIGNSADLEYGKSITDACMSLEQTEPVLSLLAESVRIRRQKTA